MTLSAPVLSVASMSTADSLTYSPATATPPLGSRFVMAVTSGKASNLARAAVGVTQNGAGAMGDLSLVRPGQAVPNSNLVVSMWTGVGTGVGGNFTITHDIAMDNCTWHAMWWTSDVATPTIKQSASNNVAATGTQSVALPQAVTAGSCVVAVLGLNLGSGTVPSVGSGFTQLGSIISSTSPTTQQMVEYDNTSPFSTPSFTVASAAGRSNNAFEVADGIAVEPPDDETGSFYLTGGVEKSATLMWWNGTDETAVVLEY